MRYVINNGSGVGLTFPNGQDADGNDLWIEIPKGESKHQKLPANVLATIQGVHVPSGLMTFTDTEAKVAKKITAAQTAEAKAEAKSDAKEAAAEAKADAKEAAADAKADAADARRHR